MSPLFMFFVVIDFILSLADYSSCHTAYPPNFDREKGLVFDFYPAQNLTPPKGAMNKTKYVTDNMDCVFACMDVHWCRSINYKIDPRSNGLHLCQLISTEQFAGKEYMVLDKSYNHYSLKNPCQKAPCRNGGKCVLQENRQHYHCNCLNGFDGEYCEKGPPKSCLEILHRKKSNGTGAHWIDLSNITGTQPLRVFCDMDTDGGGWTLVSNYVIPSSGAKPPLDVIYSYADIRRYGNGRTVISTDALRDLQAMTSFTQMRWQCRKLLNERMIDVITSKNASGYAAVNYFMSDKSTRPDSCGSFYLGPNDSSMISSQCSVWGASESGKWSNPGYEDKAYKVYDHPFFVSSKYHFIVNYNSRLECDDNMYSGNVSPGDFWKIYVR